jgi:hypothetical protein
MRRLKRRILALDMRRGGPIMANHENERRIGASAPEPGADSIVDLLLSLPENATPETDAVDRAVANRLQVELANRMRSLISEDDRREAA